MLELNLYVVDSDNFRVQKFDSSGKIITSRGSQSTGAAEFIQPYAIVVDPQGYVYVTDYGYAIVGPNSGEHAGVLVWASSPLSQQQQTENILTNASSSDGGSTGPVYTVPGASSLTNTAFKPDPAAVNVGDTETWTNNHSQPHTLTLGSDGEPDGKFNSSPNFNPLLTPGQTFQHKFRAVGQYPYFCNLHPNMVGTTTVQ